MLEITYLKHYQIDKEKWNVAIENAHNGLVYALSWYLDIVSPGWEALIAGDYNIVMPLTIKKENNKRIFFKPIFLQFLGVFGNDLKPEIIEKFIQFALKNVNEVNVWFNPQNELYPNEFYTQRESQILYLKKNYKEHYKEYNRSNKQNLKKALNESLVVSKDINMQVLTDTFKDMYAKKDVEGVGEKDYINLQQIVKYALENEEGEFYSVYYNNQICSVAFFLKWKNRYTIYAATSDLGREKRSFFMLIDQFIKDHAGQESFLDFAGSNIPGVAYLNKGFGAVSNIYYGVKI